MPLFLLVMILAAIIKMETGEPVKMFLTAGILGHLKTEDELAAVIAHELSHANPEYLDPAYDSKEVEAFLKSLPGYGNLEPSQREEIRADIGALMRLVKAGYNPWASYKFDESMAKFIARSWDQKIFSKIIYWFGESSGQFKSTHPLSEIRMEAVKSIRA